MATRRLSIEEAADVLGLSARTVRRRIRSGILPSEREATPQGYRYVVLLDVVQVDAEPVSTPLATPTDTEEQVTAALLAEVTAERDWLRRRVEELTRQHENFQVLLRQAQEARYLPPGQEHANGMTPASPMGTSRVDGRLPWWRAWLVRVLSGG